MFFGNFGEFFFWRAILYPVRGEEAIPILEGFLEGALCLKGFSVGTEVLRGSEKGRGDKEGV